MKMQRSRSFCFTVNNYTVEDLLRIGLLQPVYIIVGKEKGEKGTPHLQGYVYFGALVTIKAAIVAIPGHVEVAKGTAQQNRVYCSKQEILIEQGEIPRQGKRNDINDVKDYIRAPTATVAGLFEMATSYQSFKFGEKGLQIHARKRDFKPTVHWYWGPTGTGKTRTAHELHPDAYFKPATRWDGYEYQEVVIWDDFRAKHCDFEELLRICDRYPHQVNVKYGYHQLLFKKIIFTSPKSPHDTFACTDEDLQQLLRRIDLIIEF